MVKKKRRDIVREYPKKQLIEKLRRLADCLEKDEVFRIQIAGERITVPPVAVINIEHERGKRAEEIEFQLQWKSAESDSERIPRSLLRGSSLRWDRMV